MASHNKPNNLEVEFTDLELTVFRDGSIHRGPLHSPLVPACPSPPFPLQQVASKDLILDAAHGTWLRLFLPPILPSDHTDNEKKLPILLYFHGGAFVVCSTAQSMFHDFLCKLALHAQALIVSVEYRLAPENPFPAAWDDCFDGLLWLVKQQAAVLGGSAEGEPWLARHGDLSRIFMGGDSAGGNLVHNVAMQAAGQGSWKYHKALSHHDVEAIRRLARSHLRGMMLFHPYFTCGLDKAAALPFKDVHVLKYLKISPDHPSVNPFVSATVSTPSSDTMATTSLPPALVFIAELDYLRERGVAYYQGLLDAGKEAHLFVTHKEEHVFHLFTPSSPNVGPLLDKASSFINDIPDNQCS